MHFIGIQRRGEAIACITSGHPLGVAPLVAHQIDNARSRSRRHFGGKSIRIGSIAMSATRVNAILINGSYGNARNKEFPDA